MTLSMELYGTMMREWCGCLEARPSLPRRKDTPYSTHKKYETKSRTIMKYLRRSETTYIYTKETMMGALNKDQYIQAQMMIITGLIDHLRDNLDDSAFEEERELETLLGTLYQGCEIAVLRMKNALRDEYECCGCC